MKKILKIFLVMILMLHTINAGAQGMRTVAVSSSGVFIQNPGIFHGANDFSIKVPGIDSITVEEAKTIFAINIILVDAKKNLFRGKVTKFKMSLFSKTGEYVFESASETLTPEMKEQLQKVQRGDKLYFEWIQTELPDGSHPSASPLGFRIK